MKAEAYAERRVELEGWPVNVTSWRLGETWHANADNVSPGATLARVAAASRQEAEEKAIARARELLSRTHRRAV
jgi:hypothetical protein